MNKIYESTKMVIHDDRKPLSIEQAFELLWQKKQIRVSDLPDFSADDDESVYGSDFLINITDIINPDILENQPKEKSYQDVCNFLKMYEIYHQ